MFVFQVFALKPNVESDWNRSLWTGPIVAESKADAVRIAVDRVKALDKRAKVTRICPILDVSSVKDLHHTGLIHALEKLDAVGLLAWHLREFVTKEIDLVARLIALVKEKQELQKGLENE